MLHGNRTISIAAAACLLATGLHAQEPAYPITGEFLSVCDLPSVTDLAGGQAFRANGWDTLDEEANESLKPEDFLEKVFFHQAYYVDLTDGGRWLGVLADGELKKIQMTYCSVILVTDDVSGLREDFEAVKGLSNPQKVSNEAETRYVYEGEGSAAYVLREVPVPEDKVIVYSWIKLFGRAGFSANDLKSQTVSPPLSDPDVP